MIRSSRAAALAVLLVAAIGLGVWATRRQAPHPASPGTFRIVLLGGSTALGEPYAPHADLGRIAALYLGGALEGRALAVEMRAAPGRTATTVVEDARALAARPVPRGSAAAFLYVGNNEFLGFDRRHDLRKQERQLCDVPALTAAERRAVLGRYRDAIEKTIDLLQAAGYRVLASTAGVNLRDWDPNRSVLADPTHADSVRVWMGRAEAQAARADWRAARATFEQMLRVEPTFALACKRAADCAFALGDRSTARRLYQDAVDVDGNPYRELGAQSEILRSVCAARGVAVIEAQAILDATSPTGIAGNDVFWDNCHPRLEGYLALGRELATQLAPAGTRLEALDTARAARALGIDPAVERAILNSRGQYCYAAATLVHDPRARLTLAHQFLEAATQLDPRDADVLCSRAVLAAIEDSVPRSIEHWRAAMALDPTITRRRMDNKHVVQILRRRGVDDLAARLR